MNAGTLIARQRAYFLGGATVDREFRRARLEELRGTLEANESELLAALHADLRKSALEAYASELGFVLGEIRHALDNLKTWMKPERRRSPFLAWPARAEVRREPFGVSLIIGPWNYPLQLLLGPLVGAIAGGNTAVLKPSEAAPHTAAAVKRMLGSVFEERYIAVVEGGKDSAEALLREKFDKIFFTGSTHVGREVMAAAAKHLTPVTLELGGKSPCIVTADTPIQTTARRIAWGKFLNAGQTCVAPDHIWVDRRVAPALVDALAAAIQGFFGEDPQQSADYARIIHPGHLERLSAILGDGKIAHGGRVDAGDLYLEPTILTEVAVDAPAMTGEIFGPVLPVMEYGDLTEVLDILRASPPPLAIYLFSDDRMTQERVLRETRSGGVCVNDTISQIIGRDLPFGGLGESGMGRYHGRAGFDCFTHERSILRRSLKLDPSFRYPPARVSLDALKRMMKWFG